MNKHALARELAEQSAVLLKNEGNLLPLKPGQRVALFGRAQLDAALSGNGSGAARGGESTAIPDACIACGLEPEPALAAFYRGAVAAQAAKAEPTDIDWKRASELVHSGVIYELFGQYHASAAEPAVPAALLDEARAGTDTAVFILSRNAGGEECDRHFEGDYTLMPSEQALIDAICARFPKVVLVLNVNGPVDLSWTPERECVRAILFIGLPGQAGPEALANILIGRANPCGRLGFTWAGRYEDWPSSANFTWDKQAEPLTYASYGLDAAENGSVGFARSPVTLYAEDIYLGYRYFDSFGIEPLWPFGFGLSYTSFRIEDAGVCRCADGLELDVRVQNTGDMAGREVVQLYVHAGCPGTARPPRELNGFGKTKKLQPGEAETLTIRLPWRELACYDEETAAWRIPAGEYELRAGGTSRDTGPMLTLTVPEPIPMQQCANRLGLRPCNDGKLSFLSLSDAQSERGQSSLDDNPSTACGRMELRAEDVRPVTVQPPSPSAEALGLARSLSTEELAAMCVGYGPGTPFSAFGDGSEPSTICDEAGVPLTTNSHPVGHSGYVSPAIERRGIYSVYYKDGPAGIGGVAWPCEMLLACAFDPKIWYAFGDAMGEECEARGVDVWLAPAVNLQRHPLCGRNFEYFSEDPFLTGSCAVATVRGLQEKHAVRACPKHFALNEQETWRRGSARLNCDAVDSIARERTIRELYLRPFEMLVREAGIRFIMTSFNKINGRFAAGNEELCTRILRGEWGYRGVVITDWCDMDTVVNGADAVAAGNDIVMPGGPPVIAQILSGLRAGRLTRRELEIAVARLLDAIAAI